MLYAFSHSKQYKVWASNLEPSNVPALNEALSFTEGSLIKDKINFLNYFCGLKQPWV